MDPVLIREKRGEILLLTMNRPERRNALSSDLVTGITEALKEG